MSNAKRLWTFKPPKPNAEYVNIVTENDYQVATCYGSMAIEHARIIVDAVNATRDKIPYRDEWPAGKLRLRFDVSCAATDGDVEEMLRSMDKDPQWSDSKHRAAARVACADILLAELERKK